MAEPLPSDEIDARSALVGDLRRQISERVTGQQQLVTLTPVAIGVVAAFASQKPTEAANPTTLALLSLLFIGIALAMLRHDNEITLLASYLVSEDAFGLHAVAQRGWERHKFVTMQGSGPRFARSSIQVAGIYSIPVLAAAGAFYEGVISVFRHPFALDLPVVLLVVDVLMFGAFLIGSWEVGRQYRRLGDPVQGPASQDERQVSSAR